MTAIAMQQAAAAAAAGHQFMMQNNMQLLPAMVNQMQQASETTSTLKEATPKITEPTAAQKATPDSVTVAAATESAADV